METELVSTRPLRMSLALAFSIGLFPNLQQAYCYTCAKMLNDGFVHFPAIPYQYRYCLSMLEEENESLPSLI
uniref:Uncharacterized protein n=1 Tax=Anguilla anguilla TaxID=7936 RepID=A0A0E9W0L5_ANGAN